MAGGHRDEHVLTLLILGSNLTSQAIARECGGLL